MKKNENNKHCKKGSLRKIKCLKIFDVSEYYGDSKRYNRKAFSEGPGSNQIVTKKDYGNGIIEGRTKTGGYVAYPMRRINKK